MMHPDLKSSKGLTLVEAMCSMVIGMLAFAAIATFLNNGTFVGSDNRSRLYACNALREELETIRSMPYAAILQIADSSAFNNAQLAKLPSGIGTFNRKQAFDANSQRITLTVTWQSISGKTLTESISTYITKNGLNGV